MAPNQAYGYIVGAGIGKGRIISMDASRARAAPGVLAVITAPETKPVGTSNWNNAPLFGGPEVAHYHQAIACVVAETFEQARAAAALIRTRYERGKGRFDFPARHRLRRWQRGAVASPTGRRSAISTLPTRAPRSSSTRLTTRPTKVIR